MGLASLSLCLTSHFPFFLFFFFSLHFLLSPFGFGLLRAEVFFFFLNIYIGHGLLGWLDDGLRVHDFSKIKIGLMTLVSQASRRHSDMA